MHDSAKYLIHADITANGVVERNDVVGAIFGQTEGLLGDDLDLRELQDHSKVGRIDVDVDSEGGQSFGEITIASGLGRVETALLAASLETIERVGPCRATIEVAELEDVRRAKRRTVVERATDLLADLEDESVTSVDIVEEVRQRVRVEDVTEYEGYPAGPRVADSDAIVVVEGRADVLQLLQYGVKNAVAVEGTDVPDPVADLTRHRTVTAFLDGDRGGKLILKELGQVGAVDYVAFAPDGTAVEDLSRSQITAALREKTPYDRVVDGAGPDVVADAEPTTDDALAESSTGFDESMATAQESNAVAVESGGVTEPSAADAAPVTDAPGSPEADGGETAVESATGGTQPDTAAVADTADAADVAGSPETDSPETGEPETLAGHVQAVVGERTGRTRLLDGDGGVLTEGPADEAFDLVEAAEERPATVVVDGAITQRLLDVAAQRGVEQVVGASEGEFVKRPTSVRIRTGDEF